MQDACNNLKKTLINSKAIRKNIVETIYSARSSHIGSALSLVEIIDALYSIVDIEKIKSQSNDRDRIVLSKGHGVCALYSTLNVYGLMTSEQLASYCKNNSQVAGHVTHNVKYIEHSTGALGHGVSVAVGMAYGLKKQGSRAKVYVIVGDGELHEGSNWEAFMLASKLKLDNLFILVDQNGLSGIDGSDCCDIKNLTQKFEAFGMAASEVNGHNTLEIVDALDKNNIQSKPSAIVCRTVKGKGISFMENQNVWHYRPLGEEDYLKAKIELEALGE